MRKTISPDAFILVVANPCDSIALYVRKALSWPAERILASGCVLDSARLCFHLSERYRLPVERITAFVVGEHGNSEVALLSSANALGIPLANLGEKIDEIELEETVRKDGFLVSGLKGCTNYAVSLSSIAIMRSILDDERRVLPVSFSREANGRELFYSWPVEVGAKGIATPLNLPLSRREADGLDKSLSVLEGCARLVDAHLRG